MTDAAMGEIAAPEMMFVVVLGLGLAIFNGGVAAVLPARSRGAWLSILTVMQLALGGLLILVARSTLSQQGGDIRYSITLLFAAPIVIGGLVAAVLAVAALILPAARKRKA